MHIDGYTVKDRSGKVNTRRTAMKVNGKSVFLQRDIIVAKGAAAKAERIAREKQQEAR